MDEWNKYTHVCHSCDALIEYTSTRAVTDITCECGGKAGYLSVVSATITPTNEREQMETTAPINYDANVIVTYKDIIDGVATYQTVKVNDLEYRLDRIKRLENQLSMSNSQLGKIIDCLTVEHFYNPNTEKEEVLSELCEILGHEPKQEITITGTMTFQVRYDCPLEEVEDFDARYFLQDNLTLDAFNGDIVVDTFDVEDADVDW